MFVMAFVDRVRLLLTSQTTDAAASSKKGGKPRKEPAVQKKRWNFRTPQRTPKKASSGEQSENDWAQVGSIKSENEGPQVGSVNCDMFYYSATFSLLYIHSIFS